MPDRRAGPSMDAVLERLDALVEKVDDLKTQAKEDFDEVKSDGKEIKAQQSVDAGRIYQLEMWRARWEGMKFAMAWLPPVLTGTMAGAAVVLFSRFFGG